MEKFSNTSFWMVLYLTIVFIVSIFSEEFTLLESEHVRYEKTQMIFDGPVLFQNSLGKVNAKHAIVRMSKENKKNKFHEVEVDGDVSIELNKDTLATCGSAKMTNSGLIIMQDSVKIVLGEKGSLHANKEVHLQRDLSKEGFFQYIKCLGDIEYHLENEEKNENINLYCSGELYVDGAKREVKLTSQEGDKQIFFQDHLGKIYAHKATLHYEMEEGNFTPKQVTFEGKVRMMFREGILLQCALADLVTLNCQTKEMHFSGVNKKRVFFYDKINNLQISAPELKINRDRETHKEQFQGIGDVRFRFSENEFDQIRKHFQLEKNQL